MLSKLDIKLYTPIPLNSQASTPQPWVFQIPHNPQEANLQSTLIKTRITNHQNSSPTSILATINQLTKGTMAIMHQVALLQAEVSLLCKANKALSKYQRAKRTYIQLEGSLTIQEAHKAVSQGAIGRGVIQETQLDSSGREGVYTRI
jgi:hypothetical protein